MNLTKLLELGFEEDMNFIINSLKNISQHFLTSATAMDNIPKFVGLDNEKPSIFKIRRNKTQYSN